jgi:hypothetical protein
MRGTIAWGWSAKAFEASRRERFPRPFRHVLVRTGVVCFWTALALECRALEVWREQRAQRALLRAPRRTEPLRGWVERLGTLLPWRGLGQCVSVPAWSLPDSPKMRGLGLGHMWAVLCPYCDEFHSHSPGEGRRTPHCRGHRGERDRPYYILQFAGPLPVEHRTRFYRSSKSGLPRLLHHWAEAYPRRSEVAGLLAA